ncbi:hypothetical protein ACR9E3_28575 [Actinomycetospora sp. C-140]
MATALITGATAGIGAAEGITGVRVLAICPGWTRTELHARSGSDSPEASSSWWLDADQVVDQALADRDRGRTRSVPGTRYKALLAAVDALPHAFTRC